MITDWLLFLWCNGTRTTTTNTTTTTTVQHNQLKQNKNKTQDYSMALYNTSLLNRNQLMLRSCNTSQKHILDKWDKI